MFDGSHSAPPPLLTLPIATLDPSSSLRPCPPPQPLRLHAPVRPHDSRCSIAALIVCASIIGCCLVSASAAITVNPSTGIDSATCGVNPAPPCQTIAYAVRNLGASFVVLSAGIFIESSVNVTSAESLVISGVPSATVFDCSSRPGPAFTITNSTVSITGVTFQACYNPNATGGAVSANGSSVVVSQCSFMNCSAASGGAMSVSGPGGGLYLSVQNSNFTGNSANGGLASCPVDAMKPCSTWGGALAAFEMLNVTVSGCRMVNNTAQASVPKSAPQYQHFRMFSYGGNAVAGGGCVSVLLSGNISGSSVHISDNTFLQCRVTVSYNNGVFVGNGMPAACIAARAAVWCTINECTGYGGGLSVYFGLFAGLQLLDVASFSLALHGNDFVRCTVVLSADLNEFSGGNVYGGCVSVYMGGYSSSIANLTGVAVAAVGDTAVRNVSVCVESVSFTSCSATTTGRLGANSYGGSFSVYLGGYAWSYSSSSSTITSSSNSTSGLITASGVSLSVSNVNSSNCSAKTTGFSGANSYGGSFSLYLGGYAWSYSSSSSRTTSTSNSTSGLTTASGVSVFISNVNSSNCSATTTGFYGANSYGGSISVVHIGAYTWSIALGSSINPSTFSVCGATNVFGLVVSISSSVFADCSSRTLHSSSSIFLHFPALTRDHFAESFNFGSFGSNVSVLLSISIKLSLCM